MLKVFILHILFVFLLPKYLLRKLCIPLSLKILWDELIYIKLYAWIKLFEWTDVSKYYGLSCLLFVLRKLSLNLLMMFYDLICVVFNKIKEDWSFVNGGLGTMKERESKRENRMWKMLRILFRLQFSAFIYKITVGKWK